MQEGPGLNSGDANKLVIEFVNIYTFMFILCYVFDCILVCIN